MRKKRSEASTSEPGLLSRVGDLHLFDQGNGLIAPPVEGRYRDDEHTAEPEQMHGLSQHFR